MHTWYRTNNEPGDALRPPFAHDATSEAALPAQHVQSSPPTVLEPVPLCRQILDSLDDVCWLVTLDVQQTLYVNPAYTTLSGRSRASLYAQPHSYFDLLPSADRAAVQHALTAGQAGSFVLEHRLLTSDATEQWVEMHGIAFVANNGASCWRLILRNVTERKQQEAYIHTLMTSDALTGLFNRQYMRDQGTELLHPSRSYPAPMALLTIRLQRFKRVNERLGHTIGDDLLRQVADRLRKTVAPGDLLGRLDGTEFAILRPQSNAAEAMVLARSCWEQLHQPFMLEGQPCYVACWIGVAISGDDTASFDELHHQATAARDNARRNDRTVQLYDAEGSAVFREHLQLEADLRRALVEDELLLYYQPLYDLGKEAVFGMEALVRWQHPQRGLLSPDVFLPIAQQAGLTIALDHWVLRTALTQAASWAQAGVPRDVAINLMPQTFQDTQLVPTIASLLAVTGAPPERIIIELTEYAALHDLDALRTVVVRLQQLGVRVALDDFGSGYGALTYLHQLPVDIFKLDGSFAHGIGADPADEAVIKAMLLIGEGFQTTVVIEGVEETEQLHWLRQIGCLVVQGYVIGKPAPAHLRVDLIAFTPYT